jgi:methyl-accepting chemotaxis protein
VALNNLAASEDKAAQQQMAAAHGDMRTAQIATNGLTAGAVLFAFFLALVVSRAIARPLKQTVGVLEALAEGRLDLRLKVTGRDEVGRMAHALNIALDRLTGMLRGIGENVTTLAASSEELTSVAGQMNSSAARSASRAQAVSDASDQISHNITTVSAGAEEIGSSITEIPQHLQRRRRGRPGRTHLG